MLWTQPVLFTTLCLVVVIAIRTITFVPPVFHTQTVGSIIFLFLLMVLSVPSARAADVYVDGDVSRSGDGSRSAPFQTIQEAARSMDAGDVCHIRGGTYRETVQVPSTGTPDAPLVFRPAGEEKVTITGTNPVSGWTRDAGKVYRTSVSLGLKHRNQVFANGNMMVNARWPNAGGTDPEHLLEFQMATMGSGTKSNKIVDNELPDVDLAGARVWVSSHKRWFCWTGDVKSHGKGVLRVENNADAKGNQNAKKGGKYYVFGARSLLDTGNEWYYDRSSNTLYVRMPDGNPPGDRVEVKKRRLAFDLRQASSLVLKDLHIFGASIETGADSRNVILDGLRMKYVDHSARAEQQYGSQWNTGIKLNGTDHIVRNCEIAYSSGNGLTLSGKGLRIVNNYIHDANYIGSYAAPVTFRRGCRDAVVSHNTISRSGRTTVNVSGFYDSLLQYNDLHHAGYLTDDLGLTYGNGVEGGNSEVRYNWLHDNVSDSHNMGLYFDHGCKNILFHHNVVWGVNSAGMINNQYGNFLLYYNNTISDARNSYRSSWAAAQENSLYGCRLFNNVGTSGTAVKARGLTAGSNSWNYGKLREKTFLTPGTDPVDSARAIPGITDDRASSTPDRGAYELGERKWRPGHDFEQPPEPIDTSRSRVPFRNLLRNAAFFQRSTKHWHHTGESVKVIRDFHSQWVTDGKAMMGGYSLRLGKGRNALHQTVTDLNPETTYEFMAKFRVPNGENARLQVQFQEGKTHKGDTVSGNAPEWTRQTLRFKTGPNETDATLLLEKFTPGAGTVYVDDPGLRRMPAD